MFLTQQSARDHECLFAAAQHTLGRFICFSVSLMERCFVNHPTGLKKPNTLRSSAKRRECVCEWVSIHLFLHTLRIVMLSWAGDTGVNLKRIFRHCFGTENFLQQRYRHGSVSNECPSTIGRKKPTCFSADSLCDSGRLRTSWNPHREKRKNVSVQNYKSHLWVCLSARSISHYPSCVCSYNVYPLCVFIQFILREPKINVWN